MALLAVPEHLPRRRHGFAAPSLADRWVACACGRSLVRDHTAAITIVNRAGRARWSMRSPVGGLLHEAAGLRPARSAPTGSPSRALAGSVTRWSSARPSSAMRCSFCSGRTISTGMSVSRASAGSRMECSLSRVSSERRAMRASSSAQMRAWRSSFQVNGSSVSIDNIACRSLPCQSVFAFRARRLFPER